jgi:hypothetical protein
MAGHRTEIAAYDALVGLARRLSLDTAEAAPDEAHDGCSQGVLGEGLLGGSVPGNRAPAAPMSAGPGPVVDDDVPAEGAPVEQVA